MASLSTSNIFPGILGDTEVTILVSEGGKKIERTIPIRDLEPEQYLADGMGRWFWQVDDVLTAKREMSCAKIVLEDGKELILTTDTYICGAHGPIPFEQGWRKPFIRVDIAMPSDARNWRLEQPSHRNVLVELMNFAPNDKRKTHSKLRNKFRKEASASRENKLARKFYGINDLLFFLKGIKKISKNTPIVYGCSISNNIFKGDFYQIPDSFSPKWLLLVEPNFIEKDSVSYPLAYCAVSDGRQSRFGLSYRKVKHFEIMSLKGPWYWPVFDTFPKLPASDYSEVQYRKRKKRFNFSANGIYIFPPYKWINDLDATSGTNPSQLTIPDGSGMVFPSEPEDPPKDKFNDFDDGFAEITGRLKGKLNPSNIPVDVFDKNKQEVAAKFLHAMKSFAESGMTKDELLRILWAATSK